MLLDTSGLISYLDAADHRHEEAVALVAEGRANVTHNYVLAELVAVAQSRRLPRLTALEFAQGIVENPAIKTVWVDERLHRAGLVLLRRQLDKTYSLCDAVSFVLMKERGVSEALTTDRHFEQAGFKRLLSAVSPGGSHAQRR
ncbi:MAG: PIN domain-containing protein [Planctomycetota bacterium]|nr:PIN domain-containing protein [Planctomycetota bacterium]